jgi:hypothetical protein
VNNQSLVLFRKGLYMSSSDIPSSGATAAQRMIPGAYDRGTLTYRQAGSMGGPASGSATQPIGPSSMDAATIAESEKAGGALSRRRPNRK